MKNKIDLHIHTTITDGVFTPKEVIDEASKNGVGILSITDHDSIDAYSDDLFKYADSKNIKIINGVEISTKNNKAGIHVLGYNFNLNDIRFRERLKEIRNSRHYYLHKVAKKLNELGYSINVKELDKIESVTKAHIAVDIINDEKNYKKLLHDFGHIPNMGEFIEKIMNENCPGYVKKETVTPMEAAQIIREAKGKVILAHPVSYIHEDDFTEEDIVNIINEMKADGLEANYLYVDYNNNKIDEIAKWNKFAQKNNLFVTVGSDFHNKDGIRPEIGFVNTNFSFDDITVDKILEHILK